MPGTHTVYEIIAPFGMLRFIYSPLETSRKRNITLEKEKIIKPIIRWAGGKTWLVQKINDYLPDTFNNYYEPFVGGGAIFLYLKSTNRIQNKAYLSDINSNLIITYGQVKRNIDELIENLKVYKNTKEEYYLIRSKKHVSEINKAAQFLYLNRTSFNGIYRENLKGEYNVPYGHKIYKDLFDYQNLREFKKLLTSTYLSNQHFSKSLSKPSEGDLVFVDPPYTVAHENNGFVKYNQRIFSWKDQLKLRDELLQLSNKGVKILSTNACHESLIDIYEAEFNLTEIQRTSLVGGKGAKRGSVKELIITNY